MSFVLKPEHVKFFSCGFWQSIRVCGILGAKPGIGC